MKRAAIVGVLVVFAVVVLLATGSSDGRVDQPIAYNHRLHVEDQGLVCQDCHQRAETGTVATLPNLDVCMDCHDTDPLTDSAEELKLVHHIEQGTEVAWAPVYLVPDHVYFSHRRHVVLGEIDCTVCHGPVAEFEAPIETPFQTLSMEWCMDCHKQYQASNDCLACHN